MNGFNGYNNFGNVNGGFSPSYIPQHNGQFMMGGMPYFNSSYAYGYSGHSTRDKMISCLEDLMGEAKNEYEAGMIRDAIAYIQNSK